MKSGVHCAQLPPFVDEGGEGMGHVCLTSPSRACKPLPLSAASPLNRSGAVRPRVLGPVYLLDQPIRDLTDDVGGVT